MGGSRGAPGDPLMRRDAKGVIQDVEYIEKESQVVGCVYKRLMNWRYANGAEGEG